ncbi:HNH endonuclease, partial [Salmonella enterica]|nr:HNH endonuclease [Salmonella enterica subsp. enterica serovar Senftenberg]
EYVKYHGKKLHVAYKINHGALVERWKRFTEKYALTVVNSLNLTMHV